MAPVHRALWTVLTLLVASAVAQLPQLEARQDSNQYKTLSNSWLNPALPDDTANATVGQQFTIRWDANISQFFSSYALTTNYTNTTLWIISTDQPSYAHLIRRFVNVLTLTSYTWQVDIPASELDANPRWGFGFFPANLTTWSVPTSQYISSPRLRVYANSSAATTTTSASSSATASVRTAPPTTSTLSPSASATASPTPSPLAVVTNGLSGGAVAGVAVGAALGGLIVAGLLFFFWRRRRRARKNKQAAEAADAAAAAAATGAAPGYDASYLGDSEGKPQYAWSQTGVGTPGVHSMPGTPGFGPPAPYMAEMHGSDGHSLHSAHTGHNSYYPPMPHGSPMPPPHNRQNSDPVPPYVSSELPGSNAEMNELEDAESTRRISTNTSKSDVAALGGLSRHRGSRGSLSRRISGGSGGVSSPVGSPRVQSPLPTDRIEEGDDADGAAVEPATAAAVAKPAETTGPASATPSGAAAVATHGATTQETTPASSAAPNAAAAPVEPEEKQVLQAEKEVVPGQNRL